MKYIAIAIALLFFTGCGKGNPMTEESGPTEESPGIGLRQMALTTPPSKLSFSSDAEFPSVYGVLTDWNIGDVTATVMSMRDGTASLYTTSTFGIIGGQGHENVKLAAIRYVKIAEKYLDSAKPVTNCSYPKSGEIFYYILTYDGVKLLVGDEASIESGSDPTRPLFAAAQDVLTELRLITEKDGAQQ